MGIQGWAHSALVGQQRLRQREQEELDDAGEHVRRRPRRRQHRAMACPQGLGSGCPITNSSVNTRPFT